MVQAVLDYCANLPSERTLEACQDDVDNDGNGFTDCEDFSCSRSDSVEVVMLCETILEITFEKCSDGIDNDDNGFTDCEDFSCAQADDPAVRIACEESIGVECDVLPTPEERMACRAKGLPGSADAACSDGKDNDGDGFADCDDFDCSWNPQVTVCVGNRICE
jgi:hypothetical protein